MKILKTKKIKDFQKEFSSKFPGLKVKFYNKAHDEFSLSKSEEEIDPEKCFGDAFTQVIEDEVPEDPKMTVKEFEQIMSNLCLVNVQVFRRSNDVWIQTGRSDDWTLETQNTKGIHSIQN